MYRQIVTDAALVSKASAKLAKASTELEKAAKKILRKYTSVPHPKTRLLKPVIRRRQVSAEASKERIRRHAVHDVRFWRENAPVYRLKGVRLEDLQSRRKNADKVNAQSVMDGMLSWESDGSSGVFEDEDGNTLVAYFARRVQNDIKSSKDKTFYTPGPTTPSSMGRSPACLDQAERDGKTVHFDGIGRDRLAKTLVTTQLLLSNVGVKKSSRDGRHDDEDVLMRYEKDGGPPGGMMTVSEDERTFTLHGIEYLYQDNTFTSEVTGVLHLVHAWPDQAHDAEKHGIHPSADMLPGCNGSQYTYRYFQDTEELAIYLSAMFQAAFPEFYFKYQRAFNAGKWTVVDPGPFLGRVIVWKLHVCPHQDGLDEGPAVIFPMGHFSGGECYLPDLKIKLTYRPGEVIILMAGALYHAIGKWSPEGGVSEEGITPGRVGNVWFFPHSSYEVLKDKPAGWAMDQAGGKLKFDEGTAALSA